MYELFANFTLILHLIFILFVIFGGLFFFISSKIIYIHIPVLFWGIYIELTNSICPLTYLENWFLYQGGLNTYSDESSQYARITTYMKDVNTQRMYEIEEILKQSINVTRCSLQARFAIS